LRRPFSKGTGGFLFLNYREKRPFYGAFGGNAAGFYIAIACMQLSKSCAKLSPGKITSLFHVILQIKRMHA
jgi:UDP-N-acetylmuramyl pentapeptide phosphotransferase/UDP-N-acetylglucosamine-1-phosphate transferase